MSKHFEEIQEIAEKIERKLDLMLELIEAKNSQDWNRVEEISKQLDEIRAPNYH
jgi:uncharacterized protein Yka (UPF0111/DUF47 family)